MEELLRLIGYVMLALGLVFIATGLYLRPYRVKDD